MGALEPRVAQMAELLPEVRMFRVHPSKCASLADLYVKPSRSERPFTILRRDMNALRELCAIWAVLTASLSGGVGVWRRIPEPLGGRMRNNPLCTRPV